MGRWRVGASVDNSGGPTLVEWSATLGATLWAMFEREEEATASAMNQAGPPIYSMWGAQPQPAPEQGANRSSWRGSLILVAVMFGWMLLTLALSAIVARNDPNIEVPTEVDLGVIVIPADGWYSAADVWDVGDTGIALQSSGVYVAFWAEPYQGTNEELMSEWLDSLGRDFESFRPLPAAPVKVAGDLPGLVIHFSGVSAELGREEDELVVTAYGGIGVAMWARAEAGQLAWVQKDLDSMLRSLVVPR